MKLLDLPNELLLMILKNVDILDWYNILFLSKRIHSFSMIIDKFKNTETIVLSGNYELVKSIKIDHLIVDDTLIVSDNRYDFGYNVIKSDQENIIPLKLGKYHKNIIIKGNFYIKYEVELHTVKECLIYKLLNI